MPLWSLSDEKINELMDQMNKKKSEYETLKGTHIYQLWQADLDSLLQALDKQEEKEEKDRLAHEGMKPKAKNTGRVIPKKTNKQSSSVIKSTASSSATVTVGKVSPKQAQKASKKMEQNIIQQPQPLSKFEQYKLAESNLAQSKGQQSFDFSKIGQKRVHDNNY